MLTCRECKHFDNRRHGGSLGLCRATLPTFDSRTFIGVWSTVDGKFDYCAQFSPKGASVHGPGESCSLCRVQPYPEHPSMMEATR